MNTFFTVIGVAVLALCIAILIISVLDFIKYTFGNLAAHLVAAIFFFALIHALVREHQLIL